MDQENIGLEIAKAAVEGTGPAVVNKFSQAINRIFPFWGLKREAVNTYVEEIKNSNISPEAKLIAIASTKKKFHEIKNQTAIIDVAWSAIGNKQDSIPDSITENDNELILRLVDAAKFVSDEELQLLWGNVLAGEFEKPGSTPKNVIRILSEMSKEYAIVFSTLCSLRVGILADAGDDIQDCGQEAMVFLPNDYLQEMNINYATMRELEQLGLIIFSDVGRYNDEIPCESFPYIHIVCENHVMSIMNSSNIFSVGQVILTEAGQCIARFAPMRYNPQHMEGIRSYLEREAKLKFLPTPGIRITETKQEEGRYMEYSYKRLPIMLPQTQAPK